MARMFIAAAALVGVTSVAGGCQRTDAPPPASSAPSAQADLAGRWEGTTPLGGEVAMDATVTGDVLSGMFQIDAQHESIRGGKVVNDTFRFNASLGGVANVFSGEIKDGQLSIVRLSPDGPSAPLLLTRAK